MKQKDYKNCQNVIVYQLVRFLKLVVKQKTFDYN